MASGASAFFLYFGALSTVHLAHSAHEAAAYSHLYASEVLWGDLYLQMRTDAAIFWVKEGRGGNRGSVAVHVDTTKKGVMEEAFY